MKRISLIVALLAVFTFAGQRVVVPKELRKYTEWGILLQGSNSCIKDCALIATNGTFYGPEISMTGSSLACAKNQIPQSKITQLRSKRNMRLHCRTNHSDCMKYSSYRDIYNAEITNYEYYELIGSRKICEYREY